MFIILYITLVWQSFSFIWNILMAVKFIVYIMTVMADGQAMQAFLLEVLYWEGS